MVTVQVLTHALKGAVVAGGGVTLLQVLLARRFERPGSVARALATFVGLFRLLEGEERPPKSKDTHVKSSRAAAIAAAAALLVLDAKRRGLVVSLTCAEAIVTLGKQIPGVKDLNHIDLVVGGVVYTQLVYTWIYRPDLYAPSQLAALDRFTLRPKAILTAMRTQFPSGQMVSRCHEVWHPHEMSCTRYHVHNFVEGLPQLMRLYLPVFLVTAVGFKWKRWVHGPRPSLVQTLEQFVRTVVSLKLSSQLGVVGSCYLPVTNHELATYLSGALTTLCLFVENEKRRAGSIKTVAIYVLCTSGTWTARKLGLSSRSTTAWQLGLIAAAFATLFQHPEASQSPQLLTWLYGRSIRRPMKKSDPDHVRVSHEKS